MSILDQIIGMRKARLKQRENVFESERLRAWHTRQNITHRFATGALVEIKLTERKRP